MARMAPTQLSMVLRITSIDQTAINASNVLAPKIPKEVMIASATRDSAAPLTVTPMSIFETDLTDSTKDPIISTRSNTNPETNVDGNRYGAGDPTASKKTTPQTAPIIVALHFLPVCSMRAVIKKPLSKCSGYPSCVIYDTIPDEMIYSAENNPMCARERELLLDPKWPFFPKWSLRTVD